MENFKATNELQLKNYLEMKKKCEDEGYKIFYIFEMYFLLESRQLYAKKLVSLEERLYNSEEDFDPIKLGNFLMVAHEKNKFHEVLSGVKLIHAATNEGFCKQEFGFLDIERTKESKLLKKKRFIDAFQKMISDKTMIPNHSCILLNQSHHHLLAAGSPKMKQEDNNTKMKQREKLSKVSMRVT